MIWKPLLLGTLGVVVLPATISTNVVISNPNNLKAKDKQLYQNIDNQNDPLSTEIKKNIAFFKQNKFKLDITSPTSQKLYTDFTYKSLNQLYTNETFTSLFKKRINYKINSSDLSYFTNNKEGKYMMELAKNNISDPSYYPNIYRLIQLSFAVKIIVTLHSQIDQLKKEISIKELATFASNYLTAISFQNGGLSYDNYVRELDSEVTYYFSSQKQVVEDYQLLLDFNNISFSNQNPVNILIRKEQALSTVPGHPWVAELWVDFKTAGTKSHVFVFQTGLFEWSKPNYGSLWNGWIAL